MDFKHGLILTAISILFASCGCREDDFGRHLELEVPINTYPSKDTFFVGDTLWIEARIDKRVKVRDAASTIYLEGFDFFTSFVISEISDTVERFPHDIETVALIGEIRYLPLPTAVGYPMSYEEGAGRYEFKAGVILREEGLFYGRFSTSSLPYEEYDHPAVYACDRKRRERIDVHYENSSTSEEAYERLFLNTKVDYLIQLLHYQRYKDLGAHVFVVKER